MAKSKRKEKSEDQDDPLSLSKKVTQALGKTVDFSRMERLLAESIGRFKEQSYNTAVQMAKDSVFRIKGKVNDYLEVNWAVAILSTSRMLETANQASKLANEAKRRLQDALDSFRDGTFVDSPEVLEKLSDAAQNLYAFEMDMAREHVAAQSRALKEVQAMGGDIAAASTMLSRAAEALAEDDWTGYLDLIEKADALVEQAKETRVNEIKASASLMASKFLDDVRKAIQSGDFVSANYLVNMAEQSTPSPSISTTDQVTRMKERMVKKVRRFIAEIAPLLERAKEAGSKTDKARKDLDSAEELLKTGDYVNALMMAKKSYEAVKTFKTPTEPKEEEVPPEKEKKGRKKEKKASEEGNEEEPVEEKGAEKESDKEEAKKEEGEGKEPKEKKSKETAELEDMIEEPVLWCTRCGSVNIGVGSKGKAKCLDCGEKLTLVGRSGT